MKSDSHSLRHAIAAVGQVLRPVSHASARALGGGHALALWASLLGLALAVLAVTTVLVLRATRTLRHAPLPTELPAGDPLTAAGAIVDEHGEDSLAPFVLRPDKRFEFAGGALAAYRIVGETAVVSGDPVGPDDGAATVLARLLQRAHGAGMRVVMYGCSERHLADYRRLGMRTMRVGEEAVVDPATFTLEGRPVRKLRQSVRRIERRGWRIAALRGREIDAGVEAEIDALELTWRGEHDHMLGFAMSLGTFDPGVRHADLYLLAWSPEGELCAAMRFLEHCGKLSLDRMRRVGETPNGLNEALVCRALEVARCAGVPEVSLNYAGLGHLVRDGPSGGPLRRLATRTFLRVLRGRFQMDRLVLFNEKFSPQWRPRYLVYESRWALPRSVMRVLQAEGYLPEPRGLRAHLGGGVGSRAAHRAEILDGLPARHAEKASR